MKKIFIFLFAFLISFCTKSQAPALKMWDYRYGGTSGDDPCMFLQTSDHGYLVCGTSYSSIGFDKTDTSRGYRDYWIVRTDSEGVILWDKTFGGTRDEVMTCALALPDSGFLLGGSSNSDISVDRSQPNRNPITLSFDYWIIRIDKNGNKIWDRAFGGDQHDMLSTMVILNDGSYLLSGSTGSDSTADMTHHNYGNEDYWIVKVDTNGNKLWDFNFGGSLNDQLNCICLTSDNGCILGGASASPADGCKSQANIVGYDYWILKVDSNGTKIWDKTFGGNEEDFLFGLLYLPGDNILLAGTSNSDTGFDKSMSNHGGALDYDYWLIKTDASGNKLWDKVYGGNGYDDMVNNISFSNEGILITGTSYSNISGDKTEDNIFNMEQPWAITIDTLGNRLWDKTINNPDHTELCYGFQVYGGCYIFLSSAVLNGGDVSQSRVSAEDYWLVKYCNSVLFPIADYTSAITAFCQNSCIDFTNLSQNSTSYQWLFPGGTPASDTSANPQGICYSNSGTFDVTLIATNSNGSDTLTLPQYLTIYPQVPFSALTQIGDTLFSIPGYPSYAWFDGSASIPGAGNFYYVATHSGNYSVVVTDSNGCFATAQMLNVIASVTKIDNEISFNAQYSSGIIYLKINSTEASLRNIEITDGFGNIIDQKKIFIDKGRNEIEIPGLNLSAGIYFIKLWNTKESLAVRIFVP